MLLDFEIANCTRRCAASGRALAPGETYFSTLHMERGAPVRRDYAARRLAGRRRRTPSPGGSRGSTAATAPEPKLAPQDVLLNLFAALADEPAEAEFRYVLGLLLLRRRLVKLDETRRDGDGRDAGARLPAARRAVRAARGDARRRSERRSWSGGWSSCCTAAA